MNRQQLYWYARGYYDGRRFGYYYDDDDLMNYAEADRQAYKDGYDRGVEDYCEMDESDPGLPHILSEDIAP